MNNALTEVKPYVYTSPQGLKLEVLFVLDPEKKGYINATAIGKQFEKKPDDWLRYQNVQDYIQALLRKMNKAQIANQQSEINSSCCHKKDQVVNSRLETKTIIYNDLIIIVHGGAPGQHGTWLHPKLAVIFARWLSPDFAVWCDEQIEALLHQHPEYQKQFPELSVIFEKLEKNQQQLKNEVDQRFEQMAQMLNRFHTQSTQDHKQSLGQIFNSINQINKILNRQQADLLKPTVEVAIQQTLVDYQHSLEQMLQQMLHGQQDELIQNYLLAIKGNLELIVQRLATEPLPVTQPVTPPVTPSAIAPANLVTEIATLKTQGWSWQRIAQELNARSTPTVSGTGQWHGSSVKRYVESHAA
jgi:hypothetical protein